MVGQNAGRGMGAFMAIEMPETRDVPLTVGLMPASNGGQRRLAYAVNCHVYHLAHMDYAEDAEQDVDELDWAIHELMYTDPTLGGVCLQSGMSSLGIRTRIDQSTLRPDEILQTHFRVEFDAEVQIVV